jgi:hypothetical protein
MTLDLQHVPPDWFFLHLLADLPEANEGAGHWTGVDRSNWTISILATVLQDGSRIFGRC